MIERTSNVPATWDAEADFESGIRQFIVQRDGQALARVPENPVGKFGRPLFQSMTSCADGTLNQPTAPPVPATAWTRAIRPSWSPSRWFSPFPLGP